MLEDPLTFKVKLVCPCIMKLQEAVPEVIENNILLNVFPF
jgi:hypothetical protein